MIVRLLEHAAEVLALEKVCRMRRARLRDCSTCDDVWESALNEHPSAAVIDLDPIPIRDFMHAARRIEQSGESLFFYVVHGATRHALRALRYLAALNVEIRETYRGYHDFERTLLDADAPASQSATIAIVRALARELDALDDDVQLILMRMFVLGEADVGDEAVAAPHGIDVEELHARLQRARLPKFSEMMGVILMGHVIYKVDILGKNLQQISEEGPWVIAAKGIHKRISRRMQQTPDQILESGGFEVIVARMRKWFPAVAKA